MPRRRNHHPRRSQSPSPEAARAQDPRATGVDAADAGVELEAGVQAGVGPNATPALDVLYCDVCSFPPEYCEFGSHATRCKAWLQERDPRLFERYYSADALTSKAGALSLAAAHKLEQDTRKKEAKAEAKAESEARKRAAAKVTIKRIERNKRKHITAVHGLEAFGVDLKKAAKQLAREFATGASVARNGAGQEEIVVQGDVSGEVEALLEGGGGALGDGIGGRTGEGEVLRVEVRGKKGEV